MLQPYSMPEHVLNIREIQESQKAIRVMFEEIDKNLEALQGNILIMKSNEAGISRREKILKIVPNQVKTLDERRYEVWTRWYDSPPYTEKSLRKKLNKLCGENQYVLTVDKLGKRLAILVELTSKNNFEAIENLLEEIVPLNMVIEAGLRYNQHQSLKNYTHAELGAYTHAQIREVTT